MKILIGLISLILSFSVLSQDIFVIEKSFNPENVLHLATTVDNSNGRCEFVPPYIEAYWTIGRKNGDTAGLNFIEKPFFGPKIISAETNEVDFTIGLLKKIKISDQKITARLENCQAKAFAVVDGEEIEVKSIYAKGKFAITWVTEYIEINGIKRDGSKFYLKLEP